MDPAAYPNSLSEEQQKCCVENSELKKEIDHLRAQMLNLEIKLEKAQSKLAGVPLPLELNVEVFGFINLSKVKRIRGVSACISNHYQKRMRKNRVRKNQINEQMREKELILKSADIGTDEQSAKLLLEKHRVLMSELEAFQMNIEELRREAFRTSFEKQLMDQDKQLAVALTHHFPSSYQELFLHKGDVLMLLDATNNDLWKVKKHYSDGHYSHDSYVPASYVERIEPGSQQHCRALADQQPIIIIDSKQSQIEEQYLKLRILGEQRRRRLAEACEAWRRYMVEYRRYLVEFPPLP